MPQMVNNSNRSEEDIETSVEAEKKLQEMDQNGGAYKKQYAPNRRDDGAKLKNSKCRIFQCTGFPGCNMSFTRSEHLARHRRKHTGEKPFTCPTCSKNFSRLDNLRQHKLTVHSQELEKLAQTQEVDKKYRSRNESMTDVENKESMGYNATTLEQNKIDEVVNGSRCNTTRQELDPLNFRTQPDSPLKHTFISTPSSLSLPSGSFKDQEINNSQYSISHRISFKLEDNNKILDEPHRGSYPNNKPKKRPRPLNLIHSFVNDNISENSGNRIMKPVRSMLSPHSNVPSSAYSLSRSHNHWSGTLGSPLSPLFFQTFNQKMDAALGSPSFANRISSSFPVALRGPPQSCFSNDDSGLGKVLPSVDLLPLWTKNERIKSIKSSPNVFEPYLTNKGFQRNTTRTGSTDETRLVSIQPRIDSLLSPSKNEKDNES